MNILVLYHENISRRFPDHYRLPFFRFLKEWGHRVCFIGFRDDIVHPLLESETAFLPKRRSNALFQIHKELIGNVRDIRTASAHFFQQGFSPDVVISFNYPVLIQMGQWLAKQKGIPHVVHIGGLMAEGLMAMGEIVHKFRGLAALIVRNYQLNRANQIWVMSDEMKRYFSNYVSTKKLRVWPSAVSAKRHPDEYRSRVHEIRKKLGLPENARLMVYIGTLASSRDLGFVLEVTRLVVEEIPEARIVFFGYSPQTKDLQLLKEKSKSMGLDHYVLFHPPVPEKELPYFIKIAEVGISPFKPTFVFRHNSPLKLLEYLKAGVPVVGTNIPDQRMVIEESGSGFLTDWDERAYAGALIRMFALSSSDREKMGIKGYEWVRNERDIELQTKRVDKWLKALTAKQACGQ